MNSDIRVDLHIHSQASDGVWTAEELVEEVEKEGIGLFAVTDHNSTGSVHAAEQEARRRRLHFLPAVEIDSTFEGNIYHIVGYGIDPGASSLQGLIEHNRELMDNREFEVIRRLEQRGYHMDWEAYEQYEHDPSRGGWKALNFCIDQGLCSDVTDFFTRLFTRENPIPAPVFPHPSRAVEAISSAGGVPVVAHPYGSIGGEYHVDRLEVFAQLRDIGVRGLECYSTYHSEEQIRSARDFCDENGLLITGGSDSHGRFTAKRKLGSPYVTIRDLRLGEIGEIAGLSAQASA